MAEGERNAAVVEREMRAVIEREPLTRIDYVTVVDAVSLQPVGRIEQPVLCALAVFIGKTRLIDNFFFTP